MRQVLTHKYLERLGHKKQTIKSHKTRRNAMPLTQPSQWNILSGLPQNSKHILILNHNSKHNPQNLFLLFSNLTKFNILPKALFFHFIFFLLTFSFSCKFCNITSYIDNQKVIDELSIKHQYQHEHDTGTYT